MFTHIYAGEKIATPRVRLYEPFELMKRLYKADYEIVNGSFNMREGDELFVVRARSFSESKEAGFRMAQTLRAHNYAYITELDDSPERWANNYGATDYIDFKAAHAVTCSTEVLADMLREYNPHVKVLKNQIANLLPEKKFEDRGYITVFFGALNRSDCWRDIMPVINTVAQKYGDKLRFTVISDYEFFENLQTPHKFFALDKTMGTKEFVNYRAYISALYNADIALLPLIDTPFNRAKSDLKFIESANAQAAVLASPTVYENSVRDGETGFIYRSPAEFMTKFEILIENRQKRLDMIKAAYEYIKRHRLLINHIEERYDWMREVYARREELHRELLRRCG